LASYIKEKYNVTEETESARADTASPLYLMTKHIHQLLNDAPVREAIANIERNAADPKFVGPTLAGTELHDQLIEKLRDSKIAKGWFAGSPWFMEMPAAFYPYPTEDQDEISIFDTEESRKESWAEERNKRWDQIRQAAIKSIDSASLGKAIPLMGEMAAQNYIEQDRAITAREVREKNRKSWMHNLKFAARTILSFFNGSATLGEGLNELFFAQAVSDQATEQAIKSQLNRTEHRKAAIDATLNHCLREVEQSRKSTLALPRVSPQELYAAEGRVFDDAYQPGDGIPVVWQSTCKYDGQQILVRIRPGIRTHASAITISKTPILTALQAKTR
jgi:hypothetical protein